MKPYYEDDQGVTLYHGDNRDVLKTLPDASIDSIVTDPPYELGFMGRAWDSSGIAYDVDLWRECFRVLKPGGHLLSFGASRTFHRMAVAVEDAGFELRDSIAWLYGSGFPKSMDVGKAIEKSERGDLVRAKLLHFAESRGVSGRWLEERGVASAASFADWTTGGHAPSDRNWEIVKAALEVSADEEAAFEREVLSEGATRVGDGTVYGLGHSGRKVGRAVTEKAKEWEGWGTALKPAFEPIVVGRKPLVGTVAANVLAHGTGALNIDASRTPGEVPQVTQGIGSAPSSYSGPRAEPGLSHPHDGGRWPTNVVMDESQAAALDAQTGVLTSGANPTKRNSDKFRTAYGEFAGQTDIVPARGADSGGASRFFPTFRYEAKAPGSERPDVDGVQHATVKPLELMRWLVRLVTPPGGTVLEPFAGSGTTIEAALLEGFRCIAVEIEADHMPLIMQRVRKPLQQSLFGDWDGAA